MDIDEIKEVVPSRKDDPVQMTREKILHENINRAMALLPEDYRVILVLRVEEDMAYDEISRFLKIPRGTVMSRLARARQKLKEIFKELKVRNYAV
jgi:RNA polymerase sigma-70 factor (ECF subfamily)